MTFVFPTSKVSIKYPGSGALCDNFEKLQECQAQRAKIEANVEWGYFTETAPHMVSWIYSEFQIWTGVTKTIQSGPSALKMVPALKIFVTSKTFQGFF